MSYDITLQAKIEGIDKYLDIDTDVNTTYNVRELIEKSSGWKIKNCELNGKAEDLMPLIQKGISELTNNPNEYKKYESSNGWGTVETTLYFYERLLEYLVEYPYAYVLVH